MFYDRLFKYAKGKFKHNKYLGSKAISTPAKSESAEQFLSRETGIRTFPSLIAAVKEGTILQGAAVWPGLSTSSTGLRNLPAHHPMQWLPSLTQAGTLSKTTDDNFVSHSSAYLPFVLSSPRTILIPGPFEAGSGFVISLWPFD